MSKDNSKFFETKQIWSTVKDELLACYLRPYMQKILMTKKPVYYIDCFAGKGRFDDGSDGSPLIALNIIDDCLKTTRAHAPSISSCFIDLNYADDLKKNLGSRKNMQIVSGKYEANIEQLLISHRGQNIFLYIDPYGIKALDCGLFDRFANGRFNSIELLINMNSFGFLREACRALKATRFKVKEFDKIIGDDLVEYEPSLMDSSSQSIKDLTDIAGGDYWRQIAEDFIANKISCFDAEQDFSRKYCKRLNLSYKHVLNMPIRLKKGQQPKYRMIHATNHEDGCVLMYENICKRWEVLDEIQTGGQLNLFTSFFEGETTDLNEIETRLRKHILHYKTDTKLNIVLADFFTENGILCQRTEITNMLQEFESDGTISVTRIPSTTEKGNPSTFMTETSTQHIKIRSKR